MKKRKAIKLGKDDRQLVVQPGDKYWWIVYVRMEHESYGKRGYIYMQTYTSEQPFLVPKLLMDWLNKLGVKTIRMELPHENQTKYGLVREFRYGIADATKLRSLYRAGKRRVFKWHDDFRYVEFKETDFQWRQR